MKKKLLFGALGALFLGAGIFTATSLAQKEQISDLTLANIEALTSGEGGGRCTGKKDKETMICLCINTHACSDQHGCRS